MRSTIVGALIKLAALTSAASAQPSLASLWPNDNGMRWEFDYSYEEAEMPPNYAGHSFTSSAFLHLDGTHQIPGGLAQVLRGEHGEAPGRATDAPPALTALWRAIWRARPDLRDRIVARYGAARQDGIWRPLLLHPGYFVKTEQIIEMWQDEWDHPTWTYLENDITVGASFVHQLLPEFADDIFLYGTVAAIDATVSTNAGVFTDAVRMDYVIDMGWRVAMNDQGDAVGRSRSEVAGYMHYGPQVGPLDMLEEFFPFAEIDWGPVEWQEWLGVPVETQTLSLTSMPVASRTVTWSAVKRLFE